eukprot:scaffold10723_cov45-Prasinocladus_malaysianus.AAC.1
MMYSPVMQAAPVNMRQLIRYHNRQRMMKSDKTRHRNPLIDDTSDVSFKALDTSAQGLIQFKGAESGHTDVIKAILATSNGRFMTAGFDQKIIMWDVEKLKETKPFQHCHTAAVTQLTIDSFSNYVLSSSYDGTVRSWNMEVGHNTVLAANAYPLYSDYTFSHVSSITQSHRKRK